MSDMKKLYFAESGWCEKLNRSYEKGFYLPKNKEEYEALFPYASLPPGSSVEDDNKNHSLELSNLEKELNVKTEALELLTEEKEELQLEVNELKKQVEALNKANNELKKQVEALNSKAKPGGK